MPPSISRTEPSASTSPLAMRLAEIVERLQAGERVDLDLLCGDAPEFREELERLLPTLEAVVDFEQSLGSKTHLDVADVHPVLGTLGDFRILREIGRGGMGIVYEAEQVSLGRRVALKILPLAGTLQPQQLRRFQNEARAAATLKHPHIVGVYSVGVERGVHYYAMELIEGQSLAEAIAALQNHAAPAAQPAETYGLTDTVPVAALSTARTANPLDYYRRVSQLMSDAAAAIDFAHNQGIVHRDIKPGNLLIDANLSISVTDFGLARLESDAGVTLTGDVLGTLRYMSPEQAAGKPGLVDFRTDIHALGATLYELLTLHVPFSSEDRVGLLQQITHDAPAPVRHLDARIPVDLETIVGKAMEKDPADRYGSAAEMAADLRAFVTHRPIAARPPSFANRTQKWVRRHAKLVAAAIGVLLLALCGLTIGTVLLSSARQVAERHRRDSEANLLLAADAVDDLLKDMAAEVQSRGDLPHAEQFLDKAIGFYDQLTERSADPIVTIRAARAHNSAALLQTFFGRHDVSKKHNEKAIALLDRLTPADQDVDDALEVRAVALSGLTHYHGRSSLRPDRMEQPNSLAIGLYEQLVERQPNNSAYQQSLIAALSTQSVIYMNTNRLDDADQTYATIMQLIDRLPADVSDTDIVQNLVAGTSCNYGTLLVELGDLGRAQALFGKSVTQQQQLLARKPEDPQRQRDWMMFQWNLADCLVRRGDHVAGSQAAQELVQRFPRLQSYYEAAELLTRCAACAGTSEQSHDYRERARQMVEDSKTATDRTPDALQYLAWFLVMSPDESIRDAQYSLELSEAVIDQVGDRGIPHLVRGIALYRVREYSAAIQAFEDATAIEGVAPDILNVLFRAMAHWQAGNQDKAIELYEAANQWFANHSQQQPSVYDFLADARLQIWEQARELIKDAAEDVSETDAEATLDDPLSTPNKRDSTTPEEASR